MLPDNGRKVKQKYNYHMTTREVCLLYKYGKDWSFKWQLFISYCAFRGLRVSEALAINIMDFVDQNFTKLNFREAKTNKRRTVPIIKSLAEMTKTYVLLNSHRLKEGFLFPYYTSKKKAPYMTTEVANSLLGKLRKKIGKEHPEFLDKYTFTDEKTGKNYVRNRIGFHSLRRWFETTLFNKQESLYIVKEIMEYTDFKVLNSYLNSANVKEREPEILEETFSPIMNDFKNEIIGQTRIMQFAQA